MIGNIQFAGGRSDRTSFNPLQAEAQLSARSGANSGKTSRASCTIRVRGHFIWNSILYIFLALKQRGQDQRLWNCILTGYSLSRLNATQSRAGKPRPYGFCDLKLYFTRLKTAIRL
ncbi:MAG: hypothetical protein KME23_09340 [Goleter apudmare HA4340-LM2]|nr:hypothetical protein [Goleter apudmare HA4340-LM2]